MTLELAVIILVACMVALGIMLEIVLEAIKKRLNKTDRAIEVNALRTDHSYTALAGWGKSAFKELKEIIKPPKSGDNSAALSERERELCKKIQNDLYQMSAKYDVRNQQDYYIVMGIYLAIESITANYANNADDNAEYQASKKYLQDPVDVDRILKERKGDS